MRQYVDCAGQQLWPGCSIVYTQQNTTLLTFAIVVNVGADKKGKYIDAICASTRFFDWRLLIKGRPQKLRHSDRILLLDSLPESVKHILEEAYESYRNKSG